MHITADCRRAPDDVNLKPQDKFINYGSSNMLDLKGKIAFVAGVGAGTVGPGWGNGNATAVLFAR